MRKIHLSYFILCSVLLVSCSDPANSGNENIGELTTQVSEPEALDTALLVKTIDSKRLEIETQLGEIEKVEISTDSLRAKISQKWSRIHFYKSAGKVIRIKTYPHTSLSSRTEEFYFNEGDLILVAVEDNGVGKPGKEKGLIDKLYYFHQGHFLAEYNTSKERESGIKQWESEELKQEALEYLSILETQ